MSSFWISLTGTSSRVSSRPSVIDQFLLVWLHAFQFATPINCLGYVHQIPNLYNVFLHSGIREALIPFLSSSRIVPENMLKIIEYCPCFLRFYHMLWALSILEKFLYRSTCRAAPVNLSLMLRNNWWRMCQSLANRVGIYADAAWQSYNSQCDTKSPTEELTWEGRCRYSLIHEVLFQLAEQLFLSYFVSSDSDMATFLSNCMCSMLNVLCNDFPLFGFHVSFELHLLDLDFVLTQLITKQSQYLAPRARNIFNLCVISVCS